MMMVEAPTISQIAGFFKPRQYHVVSALSARLEAIVWFF
jgi:hypothetical protein